MRTAAAAVLCVLPIAACGPGVATQSAPAPTVPVSVPAPKPTPTPTPTHHHDHGEREHLTQPVAVPKCPHTKSPHFNTPEAAMRYLAAAWNRNDLADLCHVTNPNSRALLNEMHSEATNLSLNHCIKQPAGDYECFFDHDYPKAMKPKPKGHGHAEFQVGPAGTPGWYMTVFEGCG